LRKSIDIVPDVVRKKRRRVGGERLRNREIRVLLDAHDGRQERSRGKKKNNIKRSQICYEL
jgi:hypothetical protein